MGYITTLPIKVEDLTGCVLTLNTQTSDDGYLLAELLDGESDDVIGGFEMDNCDKIDRSGSGQVVSWNGKSGLDNVNHKERFACGSYSEGWATDFASTRSGFADGPMPWLRTRSKRTSGWWKSRWCTDRASRIWRR